MTATLHGTYWQTTPMPSLDKAVKAAALQDAKVMQIFRDHSDRYGGMLTPSQVWDIGGGSMWILTSVRRSISNLTKAGALVKTDYVQDGPYGRPESLWRLA